MSEEDLLVGDDAVHGEAAYSFEDDADVECSDLEVGRARVGVRRVGTGSGDSPEPQKV